MATTFPTTLDNFTNPSSTDPMNSATVPHATQHADLNDAVEALEAKVGVNGSAVTSSLDYRVTVLENAEIPDTIIDAKGDLIAGSAADTATRLAVGANETRLVADSAQATGLKYVADTTNYAIAAKGDLLVGTAADTLTALTVGTNGFVLTADSTTASGVKWAAASGGGGGAGYQDIFLLMGA